MEPGYKDAISKSMGGGWYCSSIMLKLKVERWKEEKRKTWILRWIMFKWTNQFLHEYIESYTSKLVTNL